MTLDKHKNSSTAFQLCENSASHSKPKKIEYHWLYKQNVDNTPNMKKTRSSAIAE